LTGPVALARTLEEDTRPVTKGEPATNPTDPVEQTPDSKAAPTTDVTALRLQLRRNGFNPIPVEADKGPRMKGWPQKIDVSEEEIRSWEKKYPRARNTGVTARSAPGATIHITIPEAAAAIEALEREHVEEHGKIYVRFGLPPKRLIPLRTEEPFPKLQRVFLAPDGSKQAIEVPSNGQQYVVAGIHPKTGKSYAWSGDDLAKIKRENLPYVRRENVELFLADATKLLIEEFGLVLKGTSKAIDNNKRLDFTQESTSGKDGEDPGRYKVADEFADLPVEDLGEGLYDSYAEPELIAAALAVIPHNHNDEHDDNYWTEIGRAPGRDYMIQIGMAVKAASNGSAEGFALFDKWRKDAPDYNADTVKKKWDGFHPTQIGFGTLSFYADKASPGWREEYETRESNSQEALVEGFALPSSEQKEAPSIVLPFRRHGEKPPLEDRAWAVEGLIPEVGTGVIAGQWGMLKTFVALDLAQCIMTGRPFINQ